MLRQRFSSSLHPPCAELEMQALDRVKWATNSLSTVLPSPQVPGDDPSLQGWQERDNSAIDLTRSA